MPRLSASNVSRLYQSTSPEKNTHVVYASDVFANENESNKKLSYRRETARQLPTWMEGEGLALQPTRPPPSLVIPRDVNKDSGFKAKDRTKD